MLRVSFAFGFFFLFCFSVLAQDAIKYLDKAKNGETEVNGTITGDSVKGLMIKSQKGPGSFLVPSMDIINVTYNSTLISSIDLKSALGKENRANLASTKEVDRLKLYEEAIKDIADLLAKVKNDGRLSKYLSFRIAKIKSDVAKINPDGFQDAIKALTAVRLDNPDSWMTLQSFKLEADLHEIKGNLDAALKLYQGIAKLPGVPSDIKTDSDFLALNLLMRANRMPEAETKIKELESSISPNDPRRLFVLLLKAQASLIINQLTTIEADLNSVIEVSDESNVRGKALNLMGEYYLKKGNDVDAFWMFLKVDTLYYQDVDEHARALFHLSKLFDKVKNDPIRSRLAKEKLLEASYAKTEYQKKIVSEK